MKLDPGELLESGLEDLKVGRAKAVAAKLMEFGAFVLEENRRTNLTGAKELASLVTEHFLDSIAPLGLIDFASPVVDVGSGAGFPGIPAALAFPHERFVLLEPRAKRAAFLESAVSRLGIANTSVIKSSALGPGAAALRGTSGTVLIRAVADPVKTIGLGLGLLRPGGCLVLYEGRLSQPTRGHKLAATRAGGGEIEVKRVSVPGLSAVRHAWIIRKLITPGRGRL